MNQPVAWLLAIGIGVLLPAQVAMNAHLRGWFRDPVVAALPNFLVGTVLLFAYVLATRPKLPSAASLSHVPLWAWLGGMIGASTLALIFVPLFFVLFEKLAGRGKDGKPSATPAPSPGHGPAGASTAHPALPVQGAAPAAAAAPAKEGA